MIVLLIIYVEILIRDFILLIGSVVDLLVGKFKFLLLFMGNGLEFCCMICEIYIKGCY